MKRTVLYAFMLLLLWSCSKKLRFETSPVVPSAEGVVTLKKDKNNNYAVALNVMRLAEPQRLQTPRSLYIVWMETEGNGTKNIGKLESSRGFLSRTLKSKLETVTPFKPTGFFITAEDDAAIQYPGGQVVLRTRY